MIQKQKELNSLNMVLIYVGVSCVIFIWFFLISIEINIKTTVHGGKINIKKENKLPDRFYSSVNKIIFSNANTSVSRDTVRVILDSQEGDNYIYNIMERQKLKIKDYNKSVVKVKIFQIF